ncbi:MAG: hypothetical protein ACRDZ4_04205 [Egibacteraceae bacterium]
MEQQDDANGAERPVVYAIWTPVPGQFSHPTVRVEHGNLAADIDEELAPVILELWRAGIHTVGCCQDEGETLTGPYHERPHYRRLREWHAGRASVEFVELAGMLAFYDALANSGPRDAFYERMAYRAAPDSWQTEVDLRDVIDDPEFDLDWRRPSKFRIDGGRVSFPRSDIPEIGDRLCRHRRGETGPHTMPTQEAFQPTPEEAARWLGDQP